MTPKPASRNWNDVQLAIVSVALVFTLVFWNSFAGPDRVKAGSQQAAQAAATEPAFPMPFLTPTPLPDIKIVFATSATPPAYTPSQPGGGGGGGSRPRGGGGGGGGGTGGS